MQGAKLPLPRIPTSHSTLSRLSLPDSYPRSPMPSLTRSSIAAPTTASAFLQASLSKMPRSNFLHPQHPAPRHFRSRLTTSRLLLSLAEQCSDKFMQLCRMTTWTDLSDVQLEEAPLFDQAFSEIEKALAKKRKAIKTNRNG